MRRVLGLLPAAVLVAGCGFSGLQDLPLPGGPDLDDPYTVTVEFRDVLSLAEHATVKVDGVTVGEVVGIDRDGWHAEVELVVDGDVALPEDATARIQQTSLLGEKFVALVGSPRDGQPRLEDGDHIPLSRTSRGSEVEEVLGATSLLLNGGGLENLRTISTELHTALDSEDVDTRRFLQELRTFVTTVDEQRDTIIATLENLDSLTRQVNDGRETVERALRTLGPALAVLADQRKPLVAMLQQLDRFGRISATVIRETGANIVADLQALQPVLTALQLSSEKLPESVEAILSFPFPDEVLRAARGDYVNLAVEIDLTPLTILANSTGLDLRGPEERR
ncbi:MAG: MCE-family lipoprotein MceE [uncultured Nocardioidaceae bacterium]|uniref:MCE-family lipoprotein MceE n=1 Tax=uncultured Nocardioidaceae bacterium TaxID=253824 RepID=A0A6J4NKQ8_9ACTN|nr:MAG: MCE-family lipoprotein MceE [uncultured Nocardioidaceae bacterium]